MESVDALPVRGFRVPQDYSEALRWYHMAADRGYANSQFNLGLMYYLGADVPQNYVLAHMWFNLSAAHFPASGNELRLRAVAMRDRLARNAMTPAQIAEAQRLAREWNPK